MFSRNLLGYCVEIVKNEEILPNQMAKLACKSIQVLEAQNIDGMMVNLFTNFYYSCPMQNENFLIQQ